LKKDVLVSVKGIQLLMRGGSEEGGVPEEPIEVVTFGSYAYRNGKHILEYDEILEETPGKTHNVITMSPDYAEVHKTGEADVDMIFEKGKTNLTYYATPYGTIEMGIATTDINLEEETDRVTLKIEYALSMNEEHVADCSLALTAESRVPDADYSTEG
jgi:uncharacterized beta-barrel protein YwiB (DUF1934 family)